MFQFYQYKIDSFVNVLWFLQSTMNNYTTRQMGLNQFCEIHRQEQRMRLLMEHISDLDRYTAEKKRLKDLETALTIYTAKLGRATKTSYEAKKEKEEASRNYEEARSRLCRDFHLDTLSAKLERAYIRHTNASADLLRLTHECETRKEQISELSFQNNRLRAKMIRMKNPCYKQGAAAPLRPPA
jgi:DNA repair exonuclease SbcCD ATPase subunit